MVIAVTSVERPFAVRPVRNEPGASAFNLPVRTIQHRIGDSFYLWLSQYLPFHSLSSNETLITYNNLSILCRISILLVRVQLCEGKLCIMSIRRCFVTKLTLKTLAMYGNKVLIIFSIAYEVFNKFRLRPDF